MANINRDYLIVLDAKSSVISEADNLKYYITDEHSQNLFINLVVKDTERINKYVEVHDPEKYQLELHIVKPNNDIVRPHLQANLLSAQDAIYAFELPKEAVDYIGTYKCELRVTYQETDETTITTSNKFKYKVKRSIYNDLDSIQDAPQYPVVIQLLDKLSDINQYEEDRRANELARQLAEQQRQTRFDTLDADMVHRITAMDDKMVDVENRVSTKEQAVDKLINDTKADINNYKEAKDQEIDEYKALKDTEINNAITTQDNKIDTAIDTQNKQITDAVNAQDSKIDTAIKAQNDKISVVENNDIVQNNRLDVLENRATTHEARITATETKNVEQDGRLDIVENRLANIGNDITNTMQPIIDEHTSRLDNIEAIDVAQNTRLDNIEVKNQEQDDRLLDIEKVNKRQDMNLKCLFAESKNNMIDITEEGNSIYLQNSTTGYTLIDEIKGNTLVNCNKEPDKELILNGNINTSRDNTVTLTEGVDGGLVDVALEGNTLVNMSKTKDSTAITKAYTVENSGNHIALQGDVDGSCRPVIEGNTLVNLMGEKISALKHRIRYFKPNTVYTLKGKCDSNTTGMWFFIKDSSDNVLVNKSLPNYDDFCFTISAEIEPVGDITFEVGYSSVDNTYFNGFSELMLLEGDYTDKPIPDYFEGLQSTFEDNLVTQEMVDSGKEVADNLGKYRVDYKVTGKNKFKLKDTPNLTYNEADLQINLSNGSVALNGTVANRWNFLEIGSIKTSEKNKTYTLTYSQNKASATWHGFTGNAYLNGKKVKDKAIFYLDGGKSTGDLKFTITTPNDLDFDEIVLSYTISWQENLPYTYDNFILSNIQIEEGNTATSYEPYKEYTKTLYLNSPLLEGDTIEEKDGGIYHLHKSELVAYTEGDEASLITDKVNTLHQLATPQYELIEQSNLAIPSYASGHLDFDTAIPVEKVDFLPFIEELTYLYANTQYTLQFVSDAATTANITLGGTSLLAQNIVKGLNKISITTPATLVDNKLIISGAGANISEVVVTDTSREFGYFEGMKSVGEGGNLVITSSNSDNSQSNTQQLTHKPLRAVGNVKDRYVLIDGKWFIERNTGYKDLVVTRGTSWAGDIAEGMIGFYSVLYLDSNKYERADSIVCDKLPVIGRGKLSTTKYDAIVRGGDYVGIVVKADKLETQDLDGLKKYINSLNAKFIHNLTSPQYEPIDYNPLEVYSDVTHITTNSAIPTNIIVKNHGFNCLLKPSTTYTISSNLGLNTVTTPSTLTEDCLRFMDTDTSDITTMKDVLVLEGDWTTKADLIPANFSGIESAFEQEYDAEKGKYKVTAKVANEDKSKENNITFYINEPLRGVGDVKDRVYIKDDKVVVQRNCGIRAYADGDFGTYLTDKVNTVYPLAEPTYEEVEYNDTKLFIESFKNSTLSYNSNIPVTSTVHYSYSVPIVDKVAQTANVTDQQDSMIIDLATQCAVMEMMLM